MDTFIICKVCDIRFDITTTSEKINYCIDCYCKEYNKIHLLCLKYITQLRISAGHYPPV